MGKRLNGKGSRLKVKAEILIRSEIHCVRIGFIHYRRYFCIRRTLTRDTQLKTFAGFIISKMGLQHHWLLAVKHEYIFGLFAHHYGLIVPEPYEYQRHFVIYPNYLKMQNSAFHRGLISRRYFAIMAFPFKKLQR